VEDAQRAPFDLRDRRDVDAAGAADQEVGDPEGEPVALKSFGLPDLDDEPTCRIGRVHAAVTAAERAQAGAQRESPRVARGLEGDPQVAAVASSGESRRRGSFAGRHHRHRSLLAQ
jgi:hypothetical protein